MERKLGAIFCTIHGKRSYFCMGRIQLNQCAVTQHTTAVDHCHMRPHAD